MGREPCVAFERELLLFWGEIRFSERAVAIQENEPFPLGSELSLLREPLL